MWLEPGGEVETMERREGDRPLLLAEARGLAFRHCNCEVWTPWWSKLWDRAASFSVEKDVKAKVVSRRPFAVVARCRFLGKMAMRTRKRHVVEKAFFVNWKYTLNLTFSQEYSY